MLKRPIRLSEQNAIAQLEAVSKGADWVEAVLPSGDRLVIGPEEHMRPLRNLFTDSGFQHALAESLEDLKAGRIEAVQKADTPRP